ncbi:MerR family DNA-binding protein [Micromonospora sp. LH3U1]|uniref:MerR family DNA-binding protein n=1 Tax=Micromonospora sp. LH3U1 TaxID=3018339 RepID=UPI003FA5606E
MFRVASILRAKQAGLPLPDIRAFLAAGDPAARKDVLRRNHGALQARMAALRSALDLLEAGLNCSHEDISTCPNYRTKLAELVEVGGRG